MGFTNDASRLSAAKRYRHAAVNDGWSIKPTYQTEDTRYAGSLEREGFKMSILTRVGTQGKYKYEVDVSIWGPDDLSIIPPDVYDWKKIKAGVKVCHICLKTVLYTVRYSFAGRCCIDCQPKMQRLHEGPGWCS